MKYQSKIYDWKTFEKNNPRATLNVLSIKKMEICPAYISKINCDCEKQIILIMIQNEKREGWHYLAVKNYLHYCITALGITSKHDGNFYCLSCLHSFSTENKLKPHEKVCKSRLLWI